MASAKESRVNLHTPEITKLSLVPRSKSTNYHPPSPRKHVAYLDNTLIVSNELENIKGQEPRIERYEAETDSIISVLAGTDIESSNAQLCLGNLRTMQANLAYIIPQYLDDEETLSRLLELKERIDETMDFYAPLPEEAKTIMMRQSMSDIYSDLAEKDEESEISDGGEHELCVVCFEERTLEDLPCGHRYCKQCIQSHLQVSLTEGKALNISCLAPSCDFTFTEPILEQFLTEKQFTRYQQFLLAASIRADPNRKGCPAPDCTGIICRNQNLDSQKDWKAPPYTECDLCSKSCCFECIRDYHPGVTCKQFERELRLKRLLTDEEDMKKWQKDNDAKPCPRCKTLIIKFEGCNHVRCSTCGENFCWICLTRGATEGHFNKPGKCFGKLFVEDEVSSIEKAVQRVGYIAFLPILGPAFAIPSAVEGIQVQRKKMNRRIDGVDYKIIISGSTANDRKRLLHTFAGDPVEAPGIPFPVYNKAVSVRLVKCRLTLIDIPPEIFSEEMSEDVQNILSDTDGFILLFRASILSGLEDSFVLYDDLAKTFARPGVPGSVFSLVGGKKSRNKKTEIPKSESKTQCKDRDLHFRQVDPSKRWGISSGFTTLLKHMLKRWEPLVKAILED